MDTSVFPVSEGRIVWINFISHSSNFERKPAQHGVHAALDFVRFVGEKRAGAQVPAHCL
jgi:hypothetical protein